MSILLIGEVNEEAGTYELLCEMCQANVGWITKSEGSELTVRGQQVLCFECEGVAAEEIPEMLIPKDNEAVVLRSLQGECELVILWAPGDCWPSVGLRWVAECLSSSPYLPIICIDGASEDGKWE